MLDSISRKDIEKISIDILKQSKALDVFPTPVDRIIHFSDLIVEGAVDLSQVDESFLSKVSSKFLSVWKEVRGFLDRSEKTIYLDLTQLATRQNFVKLHEVGHQVLPWQRQIMQYMDNDSTLSSITKEQFEAEANYFSSLTLFQHDRFDSEMGKLELSLKAGMALGKKFGGSTHASLRRMVERSRKRCALLVLERYQNISGNKSQCGKRDFFQSKKFTEHFGELNMPAEFGFEWSFAQDYIFKRKFKEDGAITLETQNGEVDFKYHFFDNTYNAFVFLFPEGELQKSRSKIIIQGY
jgi:hypothetical protein